MTSFHGPPSVPWEPDVCSVDGCSEPAATFTRLGRVARRDVCTTHYRERCRSVWETRRAGRPRPVHTCPSCGHEFEEEE